MKDLFLNPRIRFVLSFFFVFGVKTVFAQQVIAPAPDLQFFDEKCAATYIEQKQVEQLGIFGTREYFETWVEGKKREMQRRPYSFRTQAGEVRRIPVVVHVIHNGTPLGQGANIPFEQIQAQIDILNQDYSRQNPDANLTPDEYLGVAAAANIEFVLAKQDPRGLPTTGVNRVAGSKSSYTPDDDALIGQLASWPPEDYMNIWVVPLQAPYLGYSSFPISDLPGLNFPPSTRETDGVTIDYRLFGEGGNALSHSSGRTATHEIGHFFGLRHIWGDAGGCEIDDFVADTPNQSMSNNSCISSPRFSCDSRDMIENFMDYTPDQCMNLFTEGQVERMDVVLNFSPRRTSLINGRALQEPDLASNDLSLQAIIEPQDFSCATDVIPQVTVLNVGGNIVTSARLEVTLNGRRIESKNFNFNIGPGQTTDLSFDGISLSPSGNNEFQVTIISVNGTTDPDPTDNSLTSYPSIQPVITLPYVFEINDFSDTWSVRNSDSGVTWAPINLSIDGQEEELIYLNGYDYETQGELDYFISPPIDLEATPNAQLKFDLAFAPYTSEDYQESLLVAVSKDCGNTFELLEAPYHKTGQSLMTVDAMSDQFIPNSGQQFRTELVNLAQYAGEGDIRIAFVSVNGYGNNIFVRDIEILATEEYRYDLEINRVINPGPVTDGSQAAEVLEIANTGNLPISDFVIRRESSGARSQTYTVEDATLYPGETETFTFQANLNEGLNRVEYVIFNPNYDQNPGSNRSLTWHYIQDDSLIAVPWRQNFNGAADLGAWTALNPENNYTSWQLGAFPSEVDNQALALQTIEEGNSYWFASPLFDLSRTGQASVFFDWAASGFRSSDVSSFSMLVSSDGGYSYEEVWRKDNEEINTAESSAITAEDLERQHINLSAFTGEAYEKVRVAFKAEHLQGRSNPIYLDNIELFLSADPNPVDPGLGQTIIYPNPAFDLFNIVFNLEDYEDVNIQITASTGQVVHDVNYPNTLNQTYTFSTSLFARGVFIVRITGEGVSSTKRLIIQ